MADTHMGSGRVVYGVPNALAQLSEGAPGQVDALSSVYREMEPHWRLPETLNTGTPGMQTAGETYLPKFPREEVPQWEQRLARSFLYNGYCDTIEKIIAKPFSSAITLENGDKLDERLHGLETNVDLTGRTLTQFAIDLMKMGLNYGVAHFLVEMPAKRTPGERTRRDELEGGIRPYFVPISPRDLIGWREEIGANGQRRLTQIRYCESVIEPDGVYGDKVVNRVRVLNAPTGDGPGTWEKHEKDVDSKEYRKVDEGTHTYPGIPLVSYYTNRIGFMSALPALEELAWMNLMHWQSQSDQRNILRVARVGILFRKGFKKKELEKEIIIGANESLGAEDPQADVKWVEHEGKAIAAGRQDLLDIEAKMTILGLEPLIQKSGDVTATGRAISEAKSATKIQTWVRSLELALEEGYRMANYRIHDDRTTKDLPEDFSVNVFNEFVIGFGSIDDLKVLLAACTASKISNETLISEFQRRGVMADTISVDEEMDRIEEQAEKTMAGGFPTDEEEEDENDEVINEGEDEE